MCDSVAGTAIGSVVAVVVVMRIDAGPGPAGTIGIGCCPTSRTNDAGAAVAAAVAVAFGVVGVETFVIPRLVASGLPRMISFAIVGQLVVAVVATVVEPTDIVVVGVVVAQLAGCTASFLP